MNGHTPSIRLENIRCTYPAFRVLGEKTLRSRLLGRLRRLAAGEKGPPSIVALDGVFFQASVGEVVGVIGMNGAGKTTLLRVISGLLEPDSGRVAVRGRVSTVFGLGAGFAPALTGRENIHLVASLYGLPRQRVSSIEAEIIDFSELGEAIERPVKSYSSGMRARLGFSIVSFLDTDIMAMDEALTAGDVKFRAKAGNLIERFAHDQKILIVVSHSPDTILRYCSRAVLLKKGQVEMEGAPRDVCEAYTEGRQMGKTSGEFV